MDGVEHSIGRVAELRLGAAGGPPAVRVRWPAAPGSRGPAPLIVLLCDPGPANGVQPADDRLADELCSRVGAVVLCVPWAASDDDAPRPALARAEAALGWSADHAGELAADPDRLVLAGRGAGAAAAAVLALRAFERGWPGWSDR
jgi:acetyl esterase